MTNIGKEGVNYFVPNLAEKVEGFSESRMLWVHAPKLSYHILKGALLHLADRAFTNASDPESARFKEMEAEQILDDVRA